MKPGRELDALVAEKVMGLVIPPCGWGEGNNGRGSSWNFPLRPYSTDIAAAWEVIEKLWSQDKNFELTKSLLGWRVVFTKRLPECSWDVRSIQVAQYPTAPHAICLAALEVVK